MKSDENGEMVSDGEERSEEEEEDEEERKMLKRRISCHPLYGFLVEAHLDCLKVSLSLSLSLYLSLSVFLSLSLFSLSCLLLEGFSPIFLHPL